MSDVSDSTVSLRICANDLDPATVTELLECQPTKSFKKGDVKKLKDGRELRRTMGMWLLESTLPRRSSLDAQVNSILDQIVVSLDRWEKLQDGSDVELFVGIFMKEFNEGFDITSTTLSRIGERGIRLGFDIYATINSD